MDNKAVIVIKSTVPVGTCDKVREYIRTKTDKEFFVVNNPEFLKEGSAIIDFMKPDRIVIGAKNEYPSVVLADLYAPLTKKGYKIMFMSNLSAELTKYAANCFLATKISFVNEMARLCDQTGADINEVREGMGTDQRIGKYFLYPGPGYGGSCFPKDVKALMTTAKDYGMKLEIVHAAEDVNAGQKVLMAHKMKDAQGDLSGKTFTFWGVAFKANTDDIRETPAIDMLQELNKQGATVKFYDPIASDNFEKFVAENGLNAQRVDNKYEALNDSDGLVIVTEWNEFQNPDFKKIQEGLRTKHIYDARNILEASKCIEHGLAYYCIGKNSHR